MGRKRGRSVCDYELQCTCAVLCNASVVSL